MFRGGRAERAWSYVPSDGLFRARIIQGASRSNTRRLWCQLNAASGHKRHDALGESHLQYNKTLKKAQDWFLPKALTAQYFAPCVLEGPKMTTMNDGDNQNRTLLAWYLKKRELP